IRGVELPQVVTSALQPIYLVVGHVRDERGKLRSLGKKVIAIVRSIVRRECLELPIYGVRKGPQQCSLSVTSEKHIPIGAPENLEDVPPCAGEEGFELVNDPAVAANRSVEPLQVAIDDKREIVQSLARGQREGSHGFRLVHLPIAEESPHAAPVRRGQTAVLQVTHEASLQNGIDRSYAHGAGRKLPKIR